MCNREWKTYDNAITNFVLVAVLCVAGILMAIMLLVANGQDGGVSIPNVEVNVFGSPPPGFVAGGSATVTEAHGKSVASVFIAIDTRCRNNYDGSLPSCGSLIQARVPGPCLTGSTCCVSESHSEDGQSICLDRGAILQSVVERFVVSYAVLGLKIDGSTYALRNATITRFFETRADAEAFDLHTNNSIDVCIDETNVAPIIGRSCEPYGSLAGGVCTFLSWVFAAIAFVAACILVAPNFSCKRK